MNNEPIHEELTLDLYDFFGKFVSKWKQIVACMLACAVLALVGMYLADWIKEKKSIEADATFTPESLEKYNSENMTKEEWSTLVETALRYQNIIDGENDYLKKSVLMNLPNNQATDYCIQYRIDGALTNDQKQLLIDAYSAALKSNSLYSKIAESLAPQYKVESDYIQELITPYGSTTTGPVVFVQGKEGILSDSVDPEVNPTDGAAMLFRIQITGYDETFCKIVAAVIDTTIQEDASEISKLAKHTIQLSNSWSATRVASDENEDKKGHYTNLKSTRTEMDTLTSKLTEEEMALVKRAIVYDQTNNAQGQDAAHEASVSEAKLSPKNAVLGAMLGLVLVGAWFSLTYLLSPKVHSVSDMEARYGQRVLGIIQSTKPERKLTNVFEKSKSSRAKQLPKDTVMELIKQKVYFLAEQEVYSTIGISCLASGEEAHAICEELATKLSENKIKAVTIENALNGPEAIRAASRVDAIVFVEALENTNANELKETLEYFVATNRPTLGTVVLQ